MFFMIVFAIIGAVVWNRHEDLAEKGSLVRQTRQVPSFNRLRIDGVFEVHLKQGDAESVQIEAREGIMNGIITETSNNTLTLGLKKMLRIRHTNSKVYITVRDLEKIAINGVTSLQTEEPLRLRNLELEQHSVGSARLALQCDQLTARVTGVGALMLEGAGKDVVFHNTGVGEINAVGFAADVVRVENTGVGSAAVNARREISIRSTGVGNVRYKGLGKVKELHSTGVGSVERI